MRHSSWYKGKSLLLITVCLASAACGSTTTTGLVPLPRGAGSALGAGTPSATLPASTATTRPATPLASPFGGQCPIFPADNIWNQDISQLPVDPNSSQYISSIGASGFLHPDFGSNPAYGIPYNTVAGSPPAVSVSFQYADESDSGPYPIPANPAIEAGSRKPPSWPASTNCNGAIHL